MDGATDTPAGSATIGNDPRPSRVVLLGPQRPRPVLAAALARARVQGPLAVVSAGWEEREDEDQELAAHVGFPLRNLRLHARGEQLQRADPELATELAELRRRRRLARRYYDQRLAHLLDAVRELAPDGDVPDPTRERHFDEAVEQTRALDQQHLEALADLEHDFAERIRPQERAAVRQHREEVARILTECHALCIAGGHVEVLLEHVRLFGVMQACGALPIFAWSGGAMLLGSRILLFHDSPPWGPGNAEFFDRGFGVVPNAVFLPHADKRLRLADSARVRHLARRALPDRLFTLDDGSCLETDCLCGPAQEPRHLEHVRRLQADGTVREEVAR